MLFSEMMKSGLIKKADVDTITDEFVVPLFFLRTEKMNTDDDKNINAVKHYAVKHAEYFWTAVRVV
jgi:hypothetical protein